MRSVSIEDKELRPVEQGQVQALQWYKAATSRSDLDTVWYWPCPPPWPAPHKCRTKGRRTIPRRGIRGTRATIGALYLDRVNIQSTHRDEIRARRGLVGCRPGNCEERRALRPSAFTINMRNRTITCPAGEQQRFGLDSTVGFGGKLSRCPSARNATTLAQGGQPGATRVGAKTSHSRTTPRSASHCSRPAATTRESPVRNTPRTHLPPTRQSRTYLGARKKVLIADATAQSANREVIASSRRYLPAVTAVRQPRN